MDRPMIRIAVRIFGILCLAGSFVALVVDGTRSIAVNELSFARLADLLQHVLGPRFDTIKPAIERNISPLLWDPVFIHLIQIPTFIALALLGVLSILLTRRRAAKIGYITRP